MAAARLEKEKEKEEAKAASPDKEIAANTGESSGGPPPVIIRQRSMTPRSKRENNRLSYIDNEIRFLDAEQQEIDRQAAILDKRLRYRTSYQPEIICRPIYYSGLRGTGSRKGISDVVSTL
jgi:hypothetical protein